MAKDICRRYTLRLNPLDEQHAKILDFFARMEQDKNAKSKNQFLIDCILQKITEDLGTDSDDPDRKVSYRELLRMKNELQLMVKDEIIRALGGGQAALTEPKITEIKENQSDGEISDAALKAIASWD